MLPIPLEIEKIAAAGTLGKGAAGTLDPGQKGFNLRSDRLDNRRITRATVTTTSNRVVLRLAMARRISSERS